MAGHSHWKQIKYQKGATDQKRGALFSKLLRAISVAAREEPNPQFNARLRTAVEKAREANVPQENIEKAIKKADENAALEEIFMEAYSGDGIALLIKAVTDNKNRTVAETKNILKNHGAKWAEPGSVRWAFEQKILDETPDWQAKFLQEISDENKNTLLKLISDLENHDDIQRVYVNAKI